MDSGLFLTDTHAHLNDPKFANDLEETIKRAQAAGVGRIVVPGYDITSSKAAVEIAARFECVYATVGIHPHDSKHCDDEALAALAELAGSPKVVAIGEIGLDFHYDFSPRPKQFDAFRAQIDLAGTLRLPIVVHSRESNPEVMQVLKENVKKVHKGVFHCFSGDEVFAYEVLDAGLFIGVDGPVTYKASEKLRRVIAMCPMDRLLLETDCPYLSPLPYRGKRNEPAYLSYVAEEVARVKGVSVEELAAQTSKTAQDFFGLPYERGK